MKHHELIPIFEKIINQISCLAFHKRNLFFKPVGQIVRGVHVDPSGFSKDRFNLDAFIMPLCEKTDHFHFTFGKPLDLQSEDWSMLRPNLAEEMTEKIREEALPFLQPVVTLRDFASRPDLYARNPHGPKVAAYALARIGETRRAVAMIEEYLPTLNLSSCCQRDIAEESRMLRHLLIYEPEQAAATLEAWENETVRNLGLEPFRRADA